MIRYPFENPEWLWLLLLVGPLSFWLWWRRKESRPELQYPSASWLARGKGQGRAAWLWLLPLLQMSAVVLIIIALARPRTTEEKARNLSTEGIDIVMALDVSASMLAQDLKPNRLQATKSVADDFIADRPSDRIGLVVYAGESYTQTPLTTDHKILRNALDDLRYGLIQDGTAIGMGLATAVNRLKDSKAKSKVAILLTDGENNSGTVDPRTAASLAQEFKVRVYTIGVGTKGTARTPVARDTRGNFVYRSVPVNIDEELLKDIAKQTGGRYFRATDNQKLEAIYTEIDALEKTKLQDLKFYTYDEKFGLFALLALGLFFLERMLRYTWLKSFI